MRRRLAMTCSPKTARGDRIELSARGPAAPQCLYVGGGAAPLGRAVLRPRAAARTSMRSAILWRVARLAARRAVAWLPPLAPCHARASASQCDERNQEPSPDQSVETTFLWRLESNMTNSRSLGFLRYAEKCSRVGSMVSCHGPDDPRLSQNGGARHACRASRPRPRVTLGPQNCVSGQGPWITRQGPLVHALSNLRFGWLPSKSAVSRRDSLPDRGGIAGMTASGFVVALAHMCREN
jgi:hypothetical protein